MLNARGKHLLLLLLSGVSMSTVTSSVLLLKIHEVQHPSVPPIICNLVLLATFTYVATYAGCVLLAGFNAASVTLLDEIQLDIMSDLFRRWTPSNSRKFESVRYAARRYQRRPVRIQLSNFTYAEAGMEADFLRIVFENTINWLFMVTAQSHIWLLGT